MPEPRFLCSTSESAEIVARPEPGERVMWRGRAGLAEYAFEQESSTPLWTLPESTQVLVTDRRVVYAHNPGQPDQATGEVRWLWPQHIGMHSGARSPDRGSMASQVQLVCATADGSFPALVLAGGDLKTVVDADKLANALRLAIARYRVDHAERLGLAEDQTRVLSRLIIGPEFSGRPGGQPQAVSLAGGQFVPDPGTRQQPPATASRASETVSRPSEAPERAEDAAAGDDGAKDEPTVDQTERAERLRRSAARFTGNSARGRATAPTSEPAPESLRQSNS